MRLSYCRRSQMNRLHCTRSHYPWIHSQPADVERRHQRPAVLSSAHRWRQKAEIITEPTGDHSSPQPTTNAAPHLQTHTPPPCVKGNSKWGRREPSKQDMKESQGKNTMMKVFCDVCSSQSGLLNKDAGPKLKDTGSLWLQLARMADHWSHRCEQMTEEEEAEEAQIKCEEKQCELSSLWPQTL